MVNANPDSILRTTGRPGSVGRFGRRSELDGDGPGGSAPVSVGLLAGHRVEVTLPRRDVLVGPFEVALLAEAGLVLQLEAADPGEGPRGRRALDHEAAAVVHAAPPA